MLIPLSWLKDFVDIKLPLKDLMWKMTEAGLACESYQKIGEEIVLDVEVTANRPDWMSIIGVAREVAAIQGVNLRKQKEVVLPKKSANLPLDLNPNYKLFERWTGIIVENVEVKPSPKWIQERITLMGHAPINNIIDITNYVMYELGIPMHAFDYDEILGQIMTPQLAKGGEEFTSVDELSYKLPKDAIIIKDAERIIDLAGIKGGLNSGIKNSTKNVFLHVTIDDAVLVRRASQALGLRSEASAIYERVPDKGGVITSLKRAASLILETAGGSIASEIIDLKKEKFAPWKLILTPERLERVLGIKIESANVIKILSKLNLNPVRTKKGIECTIPTYRADIKIEEDLAEEVARIYGYNKFPTTLPTGTTAKAKIPYFFDDSFILKLKEIAVASGYSEAMTFSLLSKETLDKFEIEISDLVRLTNPVSLEYEYMRGSLIPSLLMGIKINSGEIVKLFEVDKIYPSESYVFSAITKGVTFREFKGLIDTILTRLNIKDSVIEFETKENYLHPSKSGTIKVGITKIGTFGEVSPQVLNNFAIKEEIYCFEFEVTPLQKNQITPKYESVPENPSRIEDSTLVFPEKTRIGEVIDLINSINKLVTKVELKDIYKDSYTFRIEYQDPNKTLTDKEVEEVRTKILTKVKEKFGGQIKE